MRVILSITLSPLFGVNVVGAVVGDGAVVGYRTTSRGSVNDFLEDDLEHAEDRLDYIDHCYRVARLDVSEAILNCMDNRILGKREEIQIYTAARKTIESALQMNEQLGKIQEAELMEKYENEEKEWLDYLESEGLDEGYGSDETEDN